MADAILRDARYSKEGIRMSPSRASVVVMSFALFVLPVGAKPPGLPTGPETEFKVPPSFTQDYYQPEEPREPSVYVPQVEWEPNSATGSGLGLAQGIIERTWVAERHGQIDGSTTTVESRNFIGLVQVSLRRVAQARDVFEMAETHRRAGDWEEALRWYRGVKTLFPTTLYAQMAEERQNQLALLRIAAEAGEEQSEEPPMADTKGSEPLRGIPPELN